MVVVVVYGVVVVVGVGGVCVGVVVVVVGGDGVPIDAGVCAVLICRVAIVVTADGGGVAAIDVGFVAAGVGCVGANTVTNVLLLVFVGGSVVACVAVTYGVAAGVAGVVGGVVAVVTGCDRCGSCVLCFGGVVGGDWLRCRRRCC